MTPASWRPSPGGAEMSGYASWRPAAISWQLMSRGRDSAATRPRWSASGGTFHHLTGVVVGWVTRAQLGRLCSAVLGRRQFRRGESGEPFCPAGDGRAVLAPNASFVVILPGRTVVVRGCRCHPLLLADAWTRVKSTVRGGRVVHGDRLAGIPVERLAAARRVQAQQARRRRHHHKRVRNTSRRRP